MKRSRFPNNVSYRVTWAGTPARASARAARARVIALATHGILNVILCALAFVIVGCSEPGAGPAPMTVNLSVWQRGVEHYIDDQGNGDPNILRDTTLPTSQPGFAMIGEADVTRSTDANGLLLGHRYINGRPWFIYLVGMIKAGKLDDIRLVALSHEAEKSSWEVSDPDDGALERYRSESPGSDASFTTFPAPSDQFKLEIDSSNITVQHIQSGAKWHLEIR